MFTETRQEVLQLCCPLRSSNLMIITTMIVGGCHCYDNIDKNDAANDADDNLDTLMMLIMMTR